jgi:rhodanese-related sulfurtransferase
MTPIIRFAPLGFLVVLSCATQNPGDPVPESVVSAETIAAAEETPVSQPVAGRVTRIMLGDLFALQQTGEALIYDVRPAFIYRLGHIPGAVSWPKSSFDSQIAQRETEIRAAKAAKKPVVIYCTDLACPDARTVAYALADRGHSVTILEGGWDAWKAGDLPTE